MVSRRRENRMTDEIKVKTESKESFDGQIDKMAEVIRVCAMAYSIATKRPASDYIAALFSRLSSVLPPATSRSCD
jgi:hypothetical protein